MADIQHTLWVLPHKLRDNASKTMTMVIARLNALFLANCLGPVNGGADQVVTAVARLAAGPTVPAANFDAVVFIIQERLHSFGPAVGGSAATENNVAGRTFLGARGGDLAEVYWGQCVSNGEAAAAIFHEAAHLKSGQGNDMHTATVGAPHGGKGLRLLRASSFSDVPSEDDLDFYRAAIARRIIPLRTSVP